LQTGNFLGIYLAKDHATAVCISPEGTVAGCLRVSLEQSGGGEAGGFDELGRRISAGLAERQLKFDEAAVALDCAMFMQHSVRSEFSDVKRITQTVRFDTEEALGTDVTDVAIAFKIDSIEQTGANMSVFTASKQLLGQILSGLQANNIDPGTVEPDVNCLARFVCHKVEAIPQAHPMFAFLSGRNGYFIVPVTLPWQGLSPMGPVAMRTFLINAAQDRNQMMVKQVSMTMALLATSVSTGTGGAIDRLEIFDTANSIDSAGLGRQLAIEAQVLDVIKSAGLTTESLGDCSDPVEFSIAYGAALANVDLPASASWRSDFMPYQGKKLRLQNTVKYFSVAATILMLALGIYGFRQVMRSNKDRAELRRKFSGEYSAVMFGQTMPGKTKEAVTKLNTALKRIKEAQKGSLSASDDEAVAGKFSLVLQSFNKCAEAVSLNIDSVTITDKSISITGSTSSRENTLKVFDAIRQTKLNILMQSYKFEAGRDSFMVTVEPKNQS
jgi:hypothetical protein